MTDELLYHFLQNNSERDKELFYKHFGKKIFATAWRMLNSKEDAEEIVQDVMIEVYNKHDRYPKSGVSLSTIIYRLTVQRSLDKIRYNKRRSILRVVLPLFNDKEADFIQVKDAHYSTDPVALLEQEELRKILYKALNTLTEGQRVAYTLYEMEDKSYQEISEIMQLSISAVESLLHKARKKLRDTLSEWQKNN